MSEKDEKTLEGYITPGEGAIRIVATDAWVTMVAEPPMAAIPLEPKQAREIAKRLRQCADRVEMMQRAKKKGEN